MAEVARIVIALEAPDVTEEVMHFLDRTGRARVVGTAVDRSQLVAAIRQLEPDAVVASPGLVGSREALNGSALLALDTSQSVGSLRRAIRAGASGFYLWPAEREELATAAARVRPQPEQVRGERAPTIAVYGARGGVGTTFVATHLAAAYARQGVRCLLFDLDLAFADVSAVVGAPDEGPLRTIADLLALADEVAPIHVEEIAWRHQAGFDVLLSPGRSDVRVGGDDVRRAIVAARGACDVVVLHVPRALDEVARAGLDAADRVLMVLGLDVLSLRDTRRAIEALGLEERSALVVNRAVRSEIAPTDVRGVFGRAPLAVIPSDRGVRAAQDHGRLLPGRGRVARAFDRLGHAAIEVSA